MSMAAQRYPLRLIQPVRPTPPTQHLHDARVWIRFAYEIGTYAADIAVEWTEACETPVPPKGEKDLALDAIMGHQMRLCDEGRRLERIFLSLSSKPWQYRTPSGQPREPAKPLPISEVPPLLGRIAEDSRDAAAILNVDGFSDQMAEVVAKIKSASAGVRKVSYILQEYMDAAEAPNFRVRLDSFWRHQLNVPPPSERRGARSIRSYQCSHLLI